VTLAEAPIRQGAASGVTGRVAPGAEIRDLRFGFPNMTLLPGGEVFAVFWCQEDCINNGRWVRTLPQPGVPAARGASPTST
jgi:hypothetical protein